MIADNIGGFDNGSGNANVKRICEIARIILVVHTGKNLIKSEIKVGECQIAPAGNYPDFITLTVDAGIQDRIDPA